MTKDALRSILPPTVQEIAYTTIDLDFTGLTIPDIIRNWNKLYPRSSRERNLVSKGRMIFCIMVKSKTIAPYRGIMMLFCDDKIVVEHNTVNYVLFTISESQIEDDDDITDLIDRFGRYLIHYSKNEVINFQEFFVKFLYDPNEKRLADEQLRKEATPL